MTRACWNPTFCLRIPTRESPWTMPPTGKQIVNSSGGIGLRLLSGLSRHNKDNRRFALHLSSRRGFARQLLVAHGGLVNERRHDRRGLLHVVGLNAIEHILIRMVRARIVFDLVLDKLKSRQADPVKGLMVSAAGVGNRNRAGAHIAERHQPLTE